MRIVVLYRPRSEHEGKVITFVEDYKRVKKIALEMFNLDTREGAEVARLYGITQYPAVIAIAENGSMQKFWQGELLPTINELEYYSREANHYLLNNHKSQT